MGDLGLINVLEKEEQNDIPVTFHFSCKFSCG